ncbi:hypothetical protein DL96DRAFT_1562991 [Flagelloscypha sp. PMI_526]|nr:hypothetical protein DL96DRAFT_1562991 [Flagelloscypha sp. PMI_526]
MIGEVLRKRQAVKDLPHFWDSNGTKIMGYGGVFVEFHREYAPKGSYGFRAQTSSLTNSCPANFFANGNNLRIDILCVPMTDDRDGSWGLFNGPVKEVLSVYRIASANSFVASFHQPQ